MLAWLIYVGVKLCMPSYMADMARLRDDSVMPDLISTCWNVPIANISKLSMPCKIGPEGLHNFCMMISPVVAVIQNTIPSGSPLGIKGSS